MKQQRVYLDTSVLGGCFDPEFAPWSNGLMRDFREKNYQAVLSEAVAVEVGPSPPRVRAVYEELMSLGAEVLTVTAETDELVSRYLAHEIVSRRYAADALHIALATIGEVDVLVSWNFRHIVRFDRIRMFNAVNREIGYKEIDIYSPREVSRYEER